MALMAMSAFQAVKFFSCVVGLVKCSIEPNHCQAISAKLFIIGRPSALRCTYSALELANCLICFFASLGSMSLAICSRTFSTLRLAASNVMFGYAPKLNQFCLPINRYINRHDLTPDDFTNKTKPTPSLMV
jgi:hypothetical protein